jgi:transposase
VADLRRYLGKHHKSDTIDAKTLVWLGQHDRDNLFPARLQTERQTACFRMCKQRARFVADVSRIKTRIRDLAELAVPGLHAQLGDFFSQMGRKLLRGYMNPHRTARLGLERFCRMCEQAHHGPIAQEDLRSLFQVFVDASRLYSEAGTAQELDLGFEVLQAEIAAELRHMTFLEPKIQKLDPMIDKLYEQIDPRKVLTAIQGIGPIIGAALTSKIGNIDNFKNIAAFRCHCGLIPRKKQTSKTDREGMKITKAGNRYMKLYLYMAAESARQWDPEFAQFYSRLVGRGKKHHKKAIVALANKMANRVYAVMKRAARNPEASEALYQLRDLQGRAVSKTEARRIALEILRQRKEEERSAGAVR